MHKSIALTLAAFAAGAWFVITPDVRAAAPADAWITTKAKIALVTADDVSAMAVNVDTIDGRVTLHGTVDSEAEKAKAEDAVAQIAGVREVRNMLQVVAPSRQESMQVLDEKLRESVVETLKRDRQLADVSVQSVNAGVVLLAGTVPTLTAHLDALETVSAVPGVRRVETEIKSPDRLGDAEIQKERGVAGATTGGVGDMWLTSAVKLRLLADERVPGMDINVDTTRGTVTLFGIVATNEAKAAAEQDAKKVEGVRTVKNALQVVPEERQEQVAAKDEELQERVEQKLAQSEALGKAGVDVDVKNGVARLTGTVPSSEDRLRAAVLARTTPGVRAVTEELRVETN
ncbi:MAG: BON domain-containing protein [bacterium]|nr:BON domain-containing protein [bacterium]